MSDSTAHIYGSLNISLLDIFFRYKIEMINFNAFTWHPYKQCIRNLVAFQSVELCTLNNFPNSTNSPCGWQIWVSVLPVLACSAVIMTLIFSQIFLKIPHTSPVKARYGVSFVDPASDWYSASVLQIIYVISYNTGLCYNGTHKMALDCI